MAEVASSSSVGRTTDYFGFEIKYGKSYLQSRKQTGNIVCQSIKGKNIMFVED